MSYGKFRSQVPTSVRHTAHRDLAAYNCSYPRSRPWILDIVPWGVCESESILRRRTWSYMAPRNQKIKTTVPCTAPTGHDSTGKSRVLTQAQTQAHVQATPGARAVCPGPRPSAPKEGPLWPVVSVRPFHSILEFCSYVLSTPTRPSTFNLRPSFLVERHVRSLETGGALGGRDGLAVTPGGVAAAAVEAIETFVHLTKHHSILLEAAGPTTGVVKEGVHA